MYCRLVMLMVALVFVTGCICHEEPPTFPQLHIDSLQISSGTNTILGPQLAISADGSAIAVWRMTTSDTSGVYDEIYVSEFRQATWNTPQSVSRSTLTGYPLTLPRVTTNSRGQVVIGWLDRSGAAPLPSLRLVRFDGSQWQPEVIDILGQQIGQEYDIRLLDDNRLTIAYDLIDDSGNSPTQVAFGISSGSVFTETFGFEVIIASSSCDNTPLSLDCNAGGATLALRANGTGVVGWRQSLSSDPFIHAHAALVDVNSQSTIIEPDVLLNVAHIDSNVHTSELTLSVHSDNTVAVALQQLVTSPSLPGGEGMVGHVADGSVTSIGEAHKFEVQRALGNLESLDFPRVAAGENGSALFAWLADLEQGPMLKARVWEPSLAIDRNPELSEQLDIDTGIVPGYQGKLGPHVALIYRTQFSQSHRSGTLVYAATASNSNAVRWAQLDQVCLGGMWFLVGPETIDGNEGQITAIDLATFANGEPMAVWIRQEDNQTVLHAARRALP